MNLETISFVLMMKNLNSSSWMRSLHCIFFWIFDLYFFKAKFMSTISREWVCRDSEIASIADMKKELYFINFLMHLLTLIDHISDFWNALLRGWFGWMCDLDTESANDEEKIEKVNVFRNRMTTLHLTKQSITHKQQQKVKESEKWLFFFYDKSSINELLTVFSMLKTQTE